MVKFNTFGFFATAHILSSVTALIVLQDINSLTAITNDCDEQIRHLALKNQSPEGAILGVHHLDEDLEDTVAGALTYLDRELLKILNVPMRDITISTPDCPVIVKTYHEFIASTTELLQAIDEKQQVHRWDGESTVFNALGWLQSLWASRTANEQSLSFIEQQLHLYKSTGCFKDMKMVLRRDVEIVEYMNDLIDTFR